MVRSINAREARELSETSDSDGWSDVDSFDSSPEASFPQFMELPPEIRRRVWDCFCPDLKFPARVLSFCLQQEPGEPPAPPHNFSIGDDEDLPCQTLRVRRLSAIHRETRSLVNEVYPDTIEFQHRKYDDRSMRVLYVLDGQLPFRKETDIIWLDLPSSVAADSLQLPSHLESLLLSEGANGIRNIGISLTDGRYTLWEQQVHNFVISMLRRFPDLERFYYGIAAEDLEREHYMAWCFDPSTDCNTYGVDLNGPLKSSHRDWRGLLWRWPTNEAIQNADNLIPRAISKYVKPIEPTAELFNWTCIPVFEFEDWWTYRDFVIICRGGLRPDLPDGSDYSGDERDAMEDFSDDNEDIEAPSDEDDDIITLNGDIDAHFPWRPRRKSICGSRPNPLPSELRDWGVEDREKGYVDSDAGDVDDERSTQSFHRFNNLPIELRYRIWELYCPDLTAPTRIYGLDIGSFGEPTAPSDAKAYEGLGLKTATRRVRKVLAVHQESRNLALKALPDTLDFWLTPEDQHKVTASSPPASLRLRKETDIIHLTEPAEWEWSEDLPEPQQKYTLPQFANVVRNLAVVQPPGAILRDDHFTDVKHLVDQFPNLENYYYIVPPDLASPRYMRWAVDARTSKLQTLHQAHPEVGVLCEKELWCWLTKDAAKDMTIPLRVTEQATRLVRIAEEKGLNLLPMTSFRGRVNFDTYVQVVEEEERMRLQAERGEPEEPDSDEEDTHGDEMIPVGTILEALLDGTLPGGLPAVGNLLAQLGAPAAAVEALVNASNNPGDDQSDL